MKHLANIVFALCATIVGLHVLGALRPSHLNWGAHFYAFFQPANLWISAIITLGMCISKVQVRVIRILGRLVEGLGKLPAPLPFIVVVSAAMACGYYFAAQLHLLGDGALLLRSLSGTDWGSNIMQSFNNQPLMYLLFRTILNFNLIASPADTYDLYIWIDRIACILFLLTIFWYGWKTKLPTIDRALLGCLLFFGAGSQFFFGYIENYVLQYVTTAAYVITGWLALQRKVSVFVPIALCAIDIVLHFGNLVFIPSVVVLVLLRFNMHEARTIVILACVGAVGLLGVYLAGYMDALLRHFLPGSVDFLAPLSVPGGNFPYAMFSLPHLLDWGNLHLLEAPLGLGIAATTYFMLPKNQQRREPALVFLAVSAACGLLFTWVTNTALGMARDWDVLSGFFIPLMVLDVYLIASLPTAETRRGILVATVAVSVFHFVPWVGTNASAERHLRRMETLNSPYLLSPGSQMFYDEALANFYFDHQQYAEAKTRYEHFVSIEPNNPRIIGNISDVYRKLGEKQKYFESLQLAVRLNTRDPGIYSNLGVEYASRGDTNRAIEYNLKALEIDPRLDKAHANLAILYTSKKDYERGRQYFDTAINLGMNDPLLFKYAADLNFFMHDFPKAIRYYDQYLSMKPDDQKARLNRQKAEEGAKGR